MSSPRDLLHIDCELVTEILTRFIRNEIQRTGFRRAVLGLSGGIDSSVVTYLAARALGSDQVLAVTMPYKTSSEATRRDSQLVIQGSGVQTLDVPITDQIDAYFARFPRASRLRLANKCARERMTVLYDQSADFEGLVLGTSNKSELLLGYGTLFGDMASAINPVGDLYKTQLRQLAAHLGVPREILAKEPTGDLWVGQTDEAELGFAYEEVDHLLFRLVDQRWRTVELIEAGFEPEFVGRVSGLIRRNHYKRRMPIIAKLSSRDGSRFSLRSRLGNLIRYPKCRNLSATLVYQPLFVPPIAKELSHETLGRLQLAESVVPGWLCPAKRRNRTSDRRSGRRCARRRRFSQRSRRSGWPRRQRGDGRHGRCRSRGTRRCP